MATYRDPVECFAPLEVIERLLEIRAEFGHQQSVYLPSSLELAKTLDAYGFTIYSFTSKDMKMNFGHYSTPVVTGGERGLAKPDTH